MILLQVLVRMAIVNVRNLAHQLDNISCEYSTQLPCIGECTNDVLTTPSSDFQGEDDYESHTMLKIQGCDYQNDFSDSNFFTDKYYDTENSEFTDCDELYPDSIHKSKINVNHYKCPCHSQDKQDEVISLILDYNDSISDDNALRDYLGALLTTEPDLNNALENLCDLNTKAAVGGDWSDQEGDDAFIQSCKDIINREEYSCEPSQRHVRFKYIFDKDMDFLTDDNTFISNEDAITQDVTESRKY